MNEENCRMEQKDKMKNEKQFITGDELKEICLKKENHEIVGGYEFAERFDWEKIAQEISERTPKPDSENLVTIHPPLNWKVI